VSDFNPDPTEGIRRMEQKEINAKSDAEIPGPTWDTEKMQEEFTVIGFLAPYVVVIRKADGVKGSLQFRHHPRVYFNFEEHKP
jgi:hypothetical protein